ncbi:MAG: GNAT family N-acetyltransferase [Pseudomonadota bacterium]|nr:GNAT family N-acetyltransferase [Pseudomonadota bacterium]
MTASSCWPVSEHLAFTPREQALPVVARAPSKERIGEFGVSVAASARGMGIGTKLFERAAIHCRSADVDILYRQFLSCNESMIHIAKKFGMDLHNHRGEADAYLKLRPANPASASQEIVEEQHDLSAPQGPPDGQTVLSIFFLAGTVFRRPIHLSADTTPLVLVSACALRCASTWLRRTLRVGVNNPFSTVHSSKLGVTLRTFA